MNYVRLYTDEDIFGQVAPQLRRRSYDVLSTPEAGNLELSDQEQLEFAVSQRRAILSFNRRCVSNVEILANCIMNILPLDGNIMVLLFHLR